MALQDDLGTLASFGIFDEASVERLANLIRTVQALTGGGSPTTRRRRGRPPGARRPGRPAKGPGRPAEASGNGRRARGTFNPTKEELTAMRTQGLTGKAIAEKHGVSLATVQNRFRSFGLTSGKRGRPAKPAKK